MKGALQTLAALGDQKLIPVQVSTPAKAYNENREDVKRRIRSIFTVGNE